MSTKVSIQQLMLLGYFVVLELFGWFFIGSIQLGVQNATIRYNWHFFFQEGENADRVAEIVKGFDAVAVICNLGFVDSFQVCQLSIKSHQ
ncbi:hypothetical protein TNCT_285262 [Trichonephila clavata]|uniref:Uncharacterized protein n=1 Tax=Trichonephila clavata TaxID=2740835 RepID=A0A8X6JDM8_TRICU|nr:hypothetical protein TNCT_285262 [Trichonephila clavata]